MLYLHHQRVSPCGSGRQAAQIPVVTEGVLSPASGWPGAQPAPDGPVPEPRSCVPGSSRLPASRYGIVVSTGSLHGRTGLAVSALGSPVSPHMLEPGVPARSGSCSSRVVRNVVRWTPKPPVSSAASPRPPGRLLHPSHQNEDACGGRLWEGLMEACTRSQTSGLVDRKGGWNPAAPVQKEREAAPVLAQRGPGRLSHRPVPRARQAPAALLWGRRLLLSVGGAASGCHLRGTLIRTHARSGSTVFGEGCGTNPTPLGGVTPLLPRFCR